jgi:rhodanese-related sulfurtransferase
MQSTKSTACELSFQQRSLFQQGYQSYTPAELKQLEWGLRFTPLACSTLTVVGLVYQLPYLLFAVATLGIWAFFAPAAHPMDLIYNHGVRRLFGAVKLPPNPFQRRLACFAAGIMNSTAAGLFLLELPTAARVVGGMLLCLQAIVIFTHFCTLSWMYEGLMRLLGRWQQPVDADTAQSLLAAGAQLIDVRGPDEFGRGHLEGAVNIPLEEIDKRAASLGDAPCLLYCQSGTRSHIAAEKLRQLGLSAAHDLGALLRAKDIVSATATAVD